MNITDFIPLAFNRHSARLSVAAQQFLEAKRIQRLSGNTLIEYRRYLRYLQTFLPKDPPANKITTAQIRNFLSNYGGLSKKTQLNIQVALSSFWSWMVVEEICRNNVMDKIAYPRPEKRTIEAFSREEVAALLGALNLSKVYARPGKRACSHKIDGEARQRAILLLLLDTGMRAAELCQIRLKDLKQKYVKVLGKGDKERILPFSHSTRAAIQTYIQTERPQFNNLDSFLFVTKNGNALRTDNLYQLTVRVGIRAGVKSNPHKFRHTFATNFLRNGGNIYALQAMLGHSSLEMVKRYLAIVQADVETVHKIASPVANWEIE